MRGILRFRRLERLLVCLDCRGAVFALGDLHNGEPMLVEGLHASLAVVGVEPCHDRPAELLPSGWHDRPLIFSRPWRVFLKLSADDASSMHRIRCIADLFAAPNRGLLLRDRQHLSHANVVREGSQVMCHSYWVRTFKGQPEEVADVREFVRRVIGDVDGVDDVVLVVSELAGNAIRHSASGDADELRQRWQGQPVAPNAPIGQKPRRQA